MNRIIFFAFLIFITQTVYAYSPNESTQIYQDKYCETYTDPIRFIKIDNEDNDEDLFYAKTPDYILWITKNQLVFDIESDCYRLIFQNTNPETRIVPIDLADIKNNRNTPIFNAVLLKELYSGIDLKIYSRDKKIEYDFIIKPGSNPESIQFDFIGPDNSHACIDGEGNLVTRSESTAIMHTQPYSYQIMDEKYVAVSSGFKVGNNKCFSFDVGRYDHDKNLIIDPFVLEYSTFLGGSTRDWTFDLAIDSAGNAYITGITDSLDFPTLNACQTTNHGGDDGWDVFLTKVNSTGDGLCYSTYLGGSADEMIGWDYKISVAVDSAGFSYITGTTESTDFPTINAFQSNMRGPWDAFITKLDPSGSLPVFSTYLGGSDYDHGSGIAVDDYGYIYVTGSTSSGDFPVINAFQKNWSDSLDAFITKFFPAGDRLVYSTFLGGLGYDTGVDIAVDDHGQVYITGVTQGGGFPAKDPRGYSCGSPGSLVVLKMNSAGSDLIYSYCLRGSDFQRGLAIAVDEDEYCYMAGMTQSDDIYTVNAYQPTHGGDYDAIVAKIDPLGAFNYATYLGGSDDDNGYDIKADNKGNAYVTGGTYRGDFPTKNVYPNKCWGGFLTKFLESGKDVEYSTYVDSGGTIALNSSGGIYLAGATDCALFPTVNAFQPFNMGDADGTLQKLFYTSVGLTPTPLPTRTPTQTPTITFTPKPTKTHFPTRTPMMTPTPVITRIPVEKQYVKIGLIIIFTVFLFLAALFHNRMYARNSG